MTRPTPQRPRVRAGFGLTILFGLTALLIGLGLDFATASGARFWFDDQPGALALFGAGLALAVVVCAHGARLALGRRVGKDKGGRDADA